MAANLDQLPADGSQRLVIRPQQSTLITFSVIIGAPSRFSVRGSC
jgi:hypothetical protein